MAVVPTVHPGEPSLADALVTLRAADDSSLPMTTRFARLDHAHVELLASRTSTVDALSTEELAAAFEAVDLLAFYAQFASFERLARYAGEMQRLLDALDARDAVATSQVTAAFETLISMREFDRARGLVERFPDRLAGTRVPRVVFAPDFAPDLPGVLERQDDGALLARNVAREGEHLVVIVGCHVSQDALEAINSKNPIADAFAEKSTIWLLPAARMTDPDFLRDWNAHHPRQRAAFAYTNAVWRNVDFAAMPHFQRFDGERLVSSVKGFDRDGNLSALEVLLRDPEVLSDNIER